MWLMPIEEIHSYDSNAYWKWFGFLSNNDKPHCKCFVFAQKWSVKCDQYWMIVNETIYKSLKFLHLSSLIYNLCLLSGIMKALSQVYFHQADE